MKLKGLMLSTLFDQWYIMFCCKSKSDLNFTDKAYALIQNRIEVRCCPDSCCSIQAKSKPSKT